MKASIIISVFNCEKYIGRAIRSCIEQSMPKEDYEIIVVNDGSTDNTERALESFGDWITVVSLEKNMGLPYACNVGIKKALSKFVVRIDADDYIHQDLLKIECLYLSLTKEMDAVSCDYYMVDEKENVLEKKSAEQFPIACGIMFRKDRLVDIGLYDEKFLLMEDEDLRIRYLAKYNIYNIPLPLYRYRMHDNNSTKNKDEMSKYKNFFESKHG